MVEDGRMKMTDYAIVSLLVLGSVFHLGEICCVTFPSDSHVSKRLLGAFVSIQMPSNTSQCYFLELMVMYCLYVYWNFIRIKIN